jgi:hypothetical protein
MAGNQNAVKELAKQHKRDLEQDAMKLIEFYGSIASTTDISQETKDLCNKNIARLLDSLQPTVELITAGLSGIKLLV